jgi:hypothetical protein
MWIALPCRANVSAGQTTLSAITALIPFSDNLSTFKILGGNIVRALEWSVRGIASGVLTGRFLQVIYIYIYSHF